ncbi:thiamine phosphate synthase [Rhodomicrobium sp. Az07]|uniref:thiamine phosphate synthase n=1 Tax=Rhodomicrobium sp. Az07 TaxID=2839034 RepID=UPI001BE8D471|nr:thiamine phosphate synthase [Rhodomicrobium sp. Az07]MBT3071393.1 thiamine phosphate synthase [Rhodomicrobium sp. Az07]
MNEKPCGLIVAIPPALETEWAARLPELVASFRPAALIVHASRENATLVKAAAPLELAVLVAGETREAARAGANGVWFPSSADADFAGARKALGADAIFGAGCGVSRHAAMEAAEAGVDFLAFDAIADFDAAADVAAWWDEVAEVPVALIVGATIPDRARVLDARPDFLLVEEALTAGESLIFATEFGLQSQT